MKGSFRNAKAMVIKMKKEATATGKTVEAAVAAAADSIGADMSLVTYEVLEAPKRGFLGIGEAPAKVRVTYVMQPADSALEFVRTVLTDMRLKSEATLTPDAKSARECVISITGEDAGVLIGHHGDTLDSLQYLTNLAVNRKEEDDDRTYMRVTVDIENYRAKREETLRTLARRMAAKVIKYKKSITLEPMNPYERRIIHSEIQNVEGVSTVSIGSDDNRRVVISSDERQPRRRKPAKPQAPAAE